MSAIPHQPSQSIPRPRPPKAAKPPSAIADLCATYDGYLAKASKARSALLRKYEPKALHAWRVSLRRMTATLDHVAAALPGEQPDGVLAQLKDFRNATGGARDLDILLDETLPAFLAHGGHGDRLEGELLHALNARRVQGHQEAVEGLKKARLTTAIHHFHAWAETQRKVSDDELRAAAASVIDTRFRQLRKRAARMHEGRTRLHRARTATKKLRYTIELFQPLFPREATQAWLERLADVQTHLGEAHDRLTARALCRELLPQAREHAQLKALRRWAKETAAEAAGKAGHSLERLHKLGHYWRH
ncbi:CHAD domain-containing protein [Dyella sp. 2RAB6]|uniref:CHAD domain-containing protein n=1 Tax=Dyella sp. 2RAB6 TaxID=3232992 RepID=UPI003F8DCE64